MSKYERLARLMKIITLVRTNKNLFRKDLARKCGVSVRTIQRDINTMIYSGVPIFCTGDGYEIMSGFFMPPVNLNPEEAFHLVTAVRVFSEHIEEDEQKIIGYAISKIIARLPDRTRHQLELMLSKSEMGVNIVNNLSHL